MQKCPNCGFEPVEENTTCPKCGFSLQLNNQEITKENKDKNDTIEWSELADMPIESVQKMFKENEDKMKEEEKKQNSTEEIPEMNPILAQYIREHKDDQEQSDPQINEQNIENTDSTDSNETAAEETPKTDNEELKELDLSAADEAETDSSTDRTQEQDLEEEQDHQEKLVADEPVETEAVEESSDVNGIDSDNVKEEPELDPVTIPEPEESAGDGDLPPKSPGTPEEKNKKSRKKLYITLAAFVVLGAGGYYYYHEKEVEAQRIATVKKENKALDSIEESLASYYMDDQEVFLTNDRVNLNTAKIAEELARYKDNKRYDGLKKDYDELVDKQEAEQAVNQLFTTSVINGDKLADKPLLKTAEPVTLSVNTGDQEFDSLMNQAINNAKDQYAKIEAARKTVGSLMKEGNVIDSVTRDQYNAANDDVKEVANQTLIQTQKDDLTKVDQFLKDKEKKAAEEKAAAEKAAQEKAAQEKANQEAQNKKTTSDTSQAGDTSSSAYAWAPGVKEKVIQTCIDRGYITSSGYSLEPVKVENGEGYYNLYATSSNAPLTEGYSNSDLPMYLVTINCKTGWFKGNGPN